MDFVVIKRNYIMSRQEGGAYRREEYYCDKCHEKRLRIKKLLAAQNNYRNSLPKLSFRNHFSKK
ncbi:hypothetical protein A7Y02_00045 [Salmonella enterica]|nr:hypothetical protein [Salmonella enterica]